MSEFLAIAEIVLRRQGRPMSAREIIEIAEREQIMPDSFTGLTPHQTLKSKLSVAIRTQPEACVFVRTAPGRFALREQVPASQVYDAPPLRPPRAREFVLGFPASRLDEIGRFDGIRTSHKRYLEKLLAGGVDAVERYEAEGRDDFKQLITYVMVTRGAELLAFKRGAFNRVEYFLRGSECVGFGGHVTAADLNLLSQADAGISRGAARELAEELRLPPEDALRVANGEGLEIIGLLNDDSSPVGRRHFAVVLRYEVVDPTSWEQAVRGEKAITQLRWLRPGENVKLNDFEYWSQLCLRTFHRGKTDGRPEIRVRRTNPFRAPHLLCVVGQIGSGKTETADLLTGACGYSAVNSGQVVAKLMGRPSVTEEDRSNFQQDALAFIQSRDGPERLGAAIAKEAMQVIGGRVVVDGLRQRATLEALRKHSSLRVATLYVHTPPDVALGLYNARAGTDVPMVEFAELREAEVEAEIPSFLSVADAVLFNWGERMLFRELVADFVRSPDRRVAASGDLIDNSQASARTPAPKLI
jgi:predicted NUDIX family phosphoesterase/dephospho-CoA kinase